MAGGRQFAAGHSRFSPCCWAARYAARRAAYSGVSAGSGGGCRWRSSTLNVHNPCQSGSFAKAIQLLMVHEVRASAGSAALTTLDVRTSAAAGTAIKRRTRGPLHLPTRALPLICVQSGAPEGLADLLIFEEVIERCDATET